jgi:cell division cycle protein 20 (cofactor of APC complex)
MIGSPLCAALTPEIRTQRCSSFHGMKIQPFNCSKHRRSSGDRDRLLPADHKSPAKKEENDPFAGQCSSPRFLPNPRVNHRRLSAISKVLDAPDVVTEFPAKLIDFNRQNQLAVALGHSIYIWEEDRVTQLMEADTDITALCWADDHIVISARGEVELWDVNRSTIIRPLAPHSERCCAMSFAGQRVATGGADAAIHVTDLRSSSRSSFPGHHEEILALAWSPDGVHLASSAYDNKVIVWGERKKRVHDFSAPIRSIAYVTPTVVAVGELNESGSIRFLYRRDGQSEMSVETGAPVSAIAFSEHWGVFAGHRQTNFQWELWSREMRRIGQYNGHNGDILNVAASQDGSMLATIGADETLQIWQLRDGKARTPSFHRDATRDSYPLLLR